MGTKVVSFFIFPKSFQTKKIKALRPKMTKIASRGPALNRKAASMPEVVSRTQKATTLWTNQSALIDDLCVLVFFFRSSGLLRERCG